MSFWDGLRIRLGVGSDSTWNSSSARDKSETYKPAAPSVSINRGGSARTIEWNSQVERRLRDVVSAFKRLAKACNVERPPPQVGAPWSLDNGELPLGGGGEGGEEGEGGGVAASSGGGGDLALPSLATITPTTATAVTAAPPPSATPRSANAGVRSRQAGQALEELLPLLALPGFAYRNRRSNFQPPPAPGPPPSENSTSEGDTATKVSNTNSSGAGTSTGSTSIRKSSRSTIIMKSRGVAVGSSGGGSCSMMGSQSGLNSARRLLLELWELLLLLNGELEENHQRQAYEAVAFLLTRTEFNVTQAPLGERDHLLHCGRDELLLLHRYRVLLFRTQGFINVQLSDIVQRNATPPLAFSQFAARVLAVSFFRLPGISRLLVQAVALAPNQLTELEVVLLTLQRPGSPHPPIGEHRPGGLSPRLKTGSLSAMHVEDKASKALGEKGKEKGKKEERDGKEEEEKEEKKENKQEKKDENQSLRRSQTQRRSAQVRARELNEKAAAAVSSLRGDEGGDGRSARRYTFTQDRCYWLVTQVSLGQRANSSRIAEPQHLGTAVAQGLSQRTHPSPPGFPDLTSWNFFHSALLARQSDSEDEMLGLTPKRWMEMFGERDRLFFVFLREWVDHIAWQAQGRTIEWTHIKGFIPFLLCIIYEMHSRKNLSKPILDCTRAFLAADPALINFFMKLTFTRTSLYDIIGVSDAFACLEAWLDSFRDQEKSLPSCFDHAFLVDAFELILSSEHHQLLLKMLMFLYQYSELFTGDARDAVFNTFVVDRHFFYFFLHWDINVRNAFHQLVAYKLLRARRSELQGNGLRVRELASVRDSRPKGETIGLHRPQVASVCMDRERLFDIMLYQKVEEKIKIAGNQLRGTVKDCYPSSWEVYVPLAITEYTRFMSQYFQWEGSDKKHPRMIPLSFVERTPPPVPILARPQTQPSDPS